MDQKSELSFKINPKLEDINTLINWKGNVNLTLLLNTVGLGNFVQYVMIYLIIWINSQQIIFISYYLIK